LIHQGVFVFLGLVSLLTKALRKQKYHCAAMVLTIFRIGTTGTGAAESWQLCFKGLVSLLTKDRGNACFLNN
jgi:hypothetical protein